MKLIDLSVRLKVTSDNYLSMLALLADVIFAVFNIYLLSRLVCFLQRLKRLLHLIGLYF